MPVIMVPSTTIIAANNARLAEQQERELISNCQTNIMPDFSNELATTEQKQQYATCVQHIYPEPSDATGKEFAQATLLWIFVSMLIGIYWYHRGKKQSLFKRGCFVDFCFGTFVGLVGIPCLFGLLVLIIVAFS